MQLNDVLVCLNLDTDVSLPMRRVKDGNNIRCSVNRDESQKDEPH